MEFVKTLLEEQKELLTEELRFAEGLEYVETKQRLFEVATALNKLFIRDVMRCYYNDEDCFGNIVEVNTHHENLCEKCAKEVESYPDDPGDIHDFSIDA